MARKCNCSGMCGEPQGDGVSRRDFLSLLGAGTAVTALSGPAWADWLQRQVPLEELDRWKKDLMRAASPRHYRSGVHANARMHLGGIGTGNVEIGCDGRFTTWQLFNTLRDGHVPLAFAVKVGNTVRLLQTAEGPNWPRIKQIDMTGEYPIATLRFQDSELPVNVELSAFTPFAPLDSRFSSQPLAALIFRIHNPTAASQTVSLAGMMQNPIGYDATTPSNGVANVKFGGNVSEPFRDGKAAGLFMRAETGKEQSLDKPVFLQVGENLRVLEQFGRDRPKNLVLAVMPNGIGPRVDAPKDARNIVWFNDPEMMVPLPVVEQIKKAVDAGATLVVSGRSMPLLHQYAKYRQHESANHAFRPDIIFEDFENGFDKWVVEGKAFGQKPAAGALDSQSPVVGFEGKGFANSYHGLDLTTGRLISKPFTIERDYVYFLIGGGSRETTQMRLIVDGRVVRTAQGTNVETLAPSVWDVREFANKKAHIEIVDDDKEPWGHINVDQIVFSDGGYSVKTMTLLDELLPARFDAISVAAGKQPSELNSLVFKNLQLQPDAKQSTLSGGLNVMIRPVGKGQVVLVGGPIVDPGRMDQFEPQQEAYAALCEMVGARYSPHQGVPRTACGFGTMALAACSENVTVLPAFEDWEVARKAFEGQGHFLPLDEAKPNAPTARGRTVNGAVAATVTVPAGGSVDVPFLLAWHFPNKYNKENVWMGCYYATLWPDAKAVVREAAARLLSIRQRTEAFRTTFYDSTLPYWMLDCITSQAATIRHIGVVFQIANGDVYGWEGSNGCCDPTCTHVWGYEQSLARLFPNLERDMRRIDFKHQQGKDGGVNNRTAFPSPPFPTGEKPFVDGHASCILKAYREALNSPDDSFFKEYWPHIKSAVEYLIHRDAATSGGTPDGTLEDGQDNTYDQQLHGITTFMSGYYLAALRAGEEWARRMGDAPTAERFHAIFLKGQDKLVKYCWNGEYFTQYLPDYNDKKYGGVTGWGAAIGEIGPGCMADQLIGQWWAHQLGLGYILPKDKVQAAMRAIFKYNWVFDLTGFKHMPRAFAGDKDKGLLIVTWPKGGRPTRVMLYSDEVWTGIEYQVAAHMIYEGMIEEGYSIVKGARDRYDGIPRAPIDRNPWNEIECGGHYARAMSSWSLLPATAGYEYDSLARTLQFAPRVAPADFKAFFCGPEGWGSLRQVQKGATQRNEIQVVEGQLVVAQLQLSLPPGATQAKVTLGDAAVEASLKAEAGGATLRFAAPVAIKPGNALVVVLS